MTKSLRWLWFALLVALPCGDLPAQTVVSWNLEWFPGRKPENPDPKVAADQMACARQTLAKLNPDIFVAIEMRDREVFQQLISVVTGMQVAVVSAFRDDEGRLAHQQVAIASRFPVHAAWAEPWEPTMARLPRGFSVAALRDPASGKLIVVYAVHFKSNRAENERDTELNNAMRNEAAFQLANDVGELSRLVFRADDVRGWILAGDFNTNHDGQFGDQAIATLERAHFDNTWATVPRKNRLTWRGGESFEPTTFDYILTRGLGQHAARLADSPEACSDHQPVVLQLDEVAKPASPKPQVLGAPVAP